MGNKIVLKADRSLFVHIIVVAQSRELDMKQLSVIHSVQYQGPLLIEMCHLEKLTRPSS